MKSKVVMMVFLLASLVFAQQKPKIDLEIPLEVRQVIDSSLAGSGKKYFSHFDERKILMGFDSSAN